MGVCVCAFVIFVNIWHQPLYSYLPPSAPFIEHVSRFLEGSCRNVCVCFGVVKGKRIVHMIKATPCHSCLLSEWRLNCLSCIALILHTPLSSPSLHTFVWTGKAKWRWRIGRPRGGGSKFCNADYRVLRIDLYFYTLYGDIFIYCQEFHIMRNLKYCTIIYKYILKYFDEII